MFILLLIGIALVLIIAYKMLSWYFQPFINSKMKRFRITYISTVIIMIILIGISVDWMNVIGYLIFVEIWYFLIIFGIIWLITVIVRAFKWKPEEKLVKRIRLFLPILAIVFSTGIVIYGYNHGNKIIVKEYVVNDSPIGNLNIVVVSDLHFGITSCERFSKTVELINKQEADLVLIAGDIFSNNIDSIKDKKKIIEQFNQIESRLGIYGVYGNHDSDDFSSGRKKIREFMSETNVIMLEDEVVLVDDSFYIVGRKDASEKRKDLDEIIKKDKPVILLDHQPVEYSNALKENVFLMVSGHTHSGQMWPLNIAIKMIWKLDYGFMKRNNTNYVVTSGVGYWNPPIRIGTTSEIVKINVKE